MWFTSIITATIAAILRNGEYYLSEIKFLKRRKRKEKNQKPPKLRGSCFQVFYLLFRFHWLLCSVKLGYFFFGEVFLVLTEASLITIG